MATHQETIIARWAPIGLCLMGLLAYGNSLAGAFVFDDYTDIIQNPQVHRGWSDLGELVSGRRQLVTLSFYFNNYIGGLDPLGFHLVNVSIHVLSALVLYGLVRRTLLLPSMPPRYHAAAPSLALLIALIWMVHPVNTQAVTYIVQRYESMMGLFYLLTLYAVLRGATAAAHGRSWYLLAILTCFLGMLCKEVMLTAPLAVILYDRTFLTSTWQEVWARRRWVHVGLWGTALLLVNSMHLALQSKQPWVGFGLPITPWVYLSSQPVVVLGYLRTALWPDNLCLDYEMTVPSVSERVIAASIVLTILAGAVFLAVKRPPLGYLLLWFFLILMPTSTLLPLSDLRFDHRIYLSVAGPIALAVVAVFELNCRLWAMARPSPFRFAPAALGLAVISVFTIATVRRNDVYASDEAIWRDVVSKRPQSPRGHFNLGVVLQRDGRLPEAMAAYEKSARLTTQHPLPATRLGFVYANELNDPAAGEKCLRVALQIEPDYVPALVGIGEVLNQLGRSQEALVYLQRARALDPEFGGLERCLAEACLHLGRTNDALAHASLATAQDTRDAAALSVLAAVLAQMGRINEAQEQCRLLVQLHPHWLESKANAAWAMATNPDAAKRNGPLARRYAQQACWAVASPSAAHLDVLAAAQAECGQFDQAIATATAALREADASRQLVLIPEIQRRLERYQHGQAFRLTAGSTP